MAQKKIVWTETAARQRRIILEYWMHRNQSNRYPLKLLRLSNEKANQIGVNFILADLLIFRATGSICVGLDSNPVGMT